MTVQCKVLFGNKLFAPLLLFEMPQLLSIGDCSVAAIEADKHILTDNAADKG